MIENTKVWNQSAPRVPLLLVADNDKPYRLVLLPDGTVRWEERTMKPKPKRWWRRGEQA